MDSPMRMARGMRESDSRKPGMAGRNLDLWGWRDIFRFHLVSPNQFVQSFSHIRLGLGLGGSAMSSHGLSLAWHLRVRHVVEAPRPGDGRWVVCQSPLVAAPRVRSGCWCWCWCRCRRLGGGGGRPRVRQSIVISIRRGRPRHHGGDRRRADHGYLGDGDAVGLPGPGPCGCVRSAWGWNGLG